MNEVYILIHGTRTWDDGGDEIVGVYAEPKTAIMAWNFYLDGLERDWRKDQSPSADNTFNRFTETVNDIIASTTIRRNDDWTHSILVQRFSIE